MYHFFNIGFLVIVCASILSIIVLLLLSILNKTSNSILISILTKTFGFILVISFYLLLLILFGTILFISLELVYIILFAILNLTCSEKTATFLSLFGTLAIGGYFPDKIGYYILKILDCVAKNKRNIFILYSVFIKFIRLKVWIYFIAFVITIISSIESIDGSNIINLSFWISIKPYIFQSVVAFLALDRLVNLIKNQISDFSNDIKKSKDFFNKNS